MAFHTAQPVPGPHLAVGTPDKVLPIPGVQLIVEFEIEQASLPQETNNIYHTAIPHLETNQWKLADMMIETIEKAVDEYRQPLHFRACPAPVALTHDAANRSLQVTLCSTVGPGGHVVALPSSMYVVVGQKGKRLLALEVSAELSAGGRAARVVVDLTAMTAPRPGEAWVVLLPACSAAATAGPTDSHSPLATLTLPVISAGAASELRELFHVSALRAAAQRGELLPSTNTMCEMYRDELKDLCEDLGQALAVPWGSEQHGNDGLLDELYAMELWECSVEVLRSSVWGGAEVNEQPPTTFFTVPHASAVVTMGAETIAHKMRRDAAEAALRAERQRALLSGAALPAPIRWGLWEQCSLGLRAALLAMLVGCGVWGTLDAAGLPAGGLSSAGPTTVLFGFALLAAAAASAVLRSGVRVLALCTSWARGHLDQPLKALGGTLLHHSRAASLVEVAAAAKRQLARPLGCLNSGAAAKLPQLVGLVLSVSVGVVVGVTPPNGAVCRTSYPPLDMLGALLGLCTEVYPPRGQAQAHSTSLLPPAARPTWPMWTSQIAFVPAWVHACVLVSVAAVGVGMNLGALSSTSRGPVVLTHTLAAAIAAAPASLLLLAPRQYYALWLWVVAPCVCMTLGLHVSMWLLGCRRSGRGAASSAQCASRSVPPLLVLRSAWRELLAMLVLVVALTCRPALHSLGMLGTAVLGSWLLLQRCQCAQCAQWRGEKPRGAPLTSELSVGGKALAPAASMTPKPSRPHRVSVMTPPVHEPKPPPWWT